MAYFPPPIPPSATPHEALFRTLLSMQGPIRQVTQPYFESFGIRGGQWGVLRNLHRAHAAGQESLRLSELVERLLIRPPSVTIVVDRLVRRGLVHRMASDNDRRAKLVSLTPAGRKLVETVLARHGEFIHRLMSGLTVAQQQETRKCLERLRQHVISMIGTPVVPQTPGKKKNRSRTGASHHA